MNTITKEINNLILKIKKWFIVRSIKSSVTLHTVFQYKPVKGDSINDLENGPFKTMAIVRMKEASLGDVEIALDGDSRIHFGEAFFETIPGVKVFAIGGDTTKTALIRIDENALLANPKFYISDICGNDFLGGETVDDVFARWEKIYFKAYGNSVVKAAWINTPPPGHPEKASMGFLEKSLQNKDRLEYAKKSFVEFEKRVKESVLVKNGFVSIIDVRTELTDIDGWQKEEYCAPDRIHHMPSAYTKVYVPKVAQKITEWLGSNR